MSALTQFRGRRRAPLYRVFSITHDWAQVKWLASAYPGQDIRLPKQYIRKANGEVWEQDANQLNAWKMCEGMTVIGRPLEWPATEPLAVQIRRELRRRYKRNRR